MVNMCRLLLCAALMAFVPAFIAQMIQQQLIKRPNFEVLAAPVVQLTGDLSKIQCASACSWKHGSKAINIRKDSNSCFCVLAGSLDLEFDGENSTSFDLYYEPSLLGADSNDVVLILCQGQRPFFYSPFGSCDFEANGTGSNNIVVMGAFTGAFTIQQLIRNGIQKTYNTQTNVWQTVSNTLTTDTALVSPYRGKFYALAAGTTGYYFDPLSNSWNGWSNTFAADGACMVTWKKYFFLFGGSNNIFRVSKYNHDTSTWSNLADMPVGRQGHACALLPQDKNKILLVGGMSGSTYSSSSVFDVDTQSWTLPTATLSHDHGRPIVFALSGRMFVAGGVEHMQQMARRDVEEYHLSSNSWTVISRPPMYMLSRGVAIPGTVSSFAALKNVNCDVNP